MPDAHRRRLEALLSQRDFPADAFRIHEAFRGKKLVLYGAGECSHWFVEVVMKIHGVRPELVLDRAFSEGGTYEGVPARSPVGFRPPPDLVRDAVVIIALGKEELYPEIRACLAELGFSDVRSLRDVYEIHNPFDQPRALRDEGFAFYRRNAEKILDTLSMLEDEASRDVYAACMETHLSRKPVAIPRRARDEQYFPTDVKLSKGHRRFVCCGCYDGDTVRLLHQKVGKVEAIACLEPEMHLFRRLSTNLWAQASELADHVVAMPCAAWDTDDVVPFVSGTGLGSRIDEQGTSRVQCVTLDQALPGFRPTFVCMDIEGAELRALKGADRILRAHRPDLGVCVYHAPDHLWEIAHHLRSLDLGYRFHLRNHTGYINETVLYATA